MTSPSPKSRIYLDHNSTTRPSSEVVSKVQSWLLDWGNPSSVHDQGRGPKTLIREARVSFASMIGASPLEVVFTSTGSEGNNHAIRGSFESWMRKADRLNAKPHILVGATEHPSVKGAAQSLKAHGVEVEVIAVQRDGRVDLEKFKSQLRPGQTFLVSMMLANNETGSLFPIAEMARLTHESGALFHSDCVQALGKIPVDVTKLGVDLATFAGHKFYALRGSAVLYIRKGVQVENLIYGGGHERARRGGTENTLAIASLGLMCTRAHLVADKATLLGQMRDQMEAKLQNLIPEISITGAGVARIPNTSSLVVPFVDGETLLMNLDMAGISVSTGAACSSGSQEPSPVLMAMGLRREEAQSSLRISLGWESTPEEISHFCETLFNIVKRTRSLQNKTGAHFSEEV
jgi:cysteine desulfurase